MQRRSKLVLTTLKLDYEAFRSVRPKAGGFQLSQLSILATSKTIKSVPIVVSWIQLTATLLTATAKTLQDNLADVKRAETSGTASSTVS